MRLARYLIVPALLWPSHRVQQPPDPFIWLEDVGSTRAMQWVEAQNKKTLDLLTRTPVYDSVYGRALELLNSNERIAYPEVRGDQVYNFWQDASHERGIWRRTTLANYASRRFVWETVLDLDSLGKAEGKSFTFGGASCLPPKYVRCLVNLSRGGSDAAEVREFDTWRRAFVPNGFVLPEAKSSVAWIDSNTVFVGTDFGPGSMTTSGYPRVVKVWRRGAPLAQARQVYEGHEKDVWVGASTVFGASRTYQLLQRGITFYEFENFAVEGDRLTKLDIPKDVSPSIVADQLVFQLKTDWTVGGKSYPQGAVLSIAYDAFMRGDRGFTAVAAPDERSSVSEIGSTRDLLLVNVLHDVKSELWRYRLDGARWVGERVPAPEGGTISLASTSETANDFFFSFQNFLQPTTLYTVRDGRSAPESVKSLPAFFDATGLVLEQLEATSKDGTRVPYFLVHRRGYALDGSNPTLLYGYGGFEVASVPTYNNQLGAQWLSRGGVYALANIRGGGEFGPRWHKAALRENRQRAYDDFIAVAEDLIARRITSPRHLGIRGGSNGGLLVGVVFVQRPDLFNAVVCDNPLLDMRRYNQLLAGASWMGEYGNPDVPEEWAFIAKYSPYQNVVGGTKYPRVLFTTTTRDDRVHPGHARKMAAKMQDQAHDVLFWENTEGGHGAGATNAQRARTVAVQYSYLLMQLKSEGAAVVP